jgi:hypothetical protein
MNKPPFYPNRKADSRGKRIALLLLFILFVLVLLGGCKTKPPQKKPVSQGDTVTVIIEGTPVSFIRIDSGATVDLRSRRRSGEVIWPQEEKPKPPRRSAPLIVINKDKSRTTIVSGDGNNVSEAKIKDKSDDTNVRGDGNTTIDDVRRAPVVVGDGNRLDESNGLHPLWLLAALLLVLLVVFRKRLGFPFKI